MLEALGDFDALVVTTARSIAKRPVGFDGLIALSGADVLEVAASAQTMPQALDLYNLLLSNVRERGGEVRVCGISPGSGPNEESITSQTRED